MNPEQQSQENVGTHDQAVIERASASSVESALTHPDARPARNAVMVGVLAVIVVVLILLFVWSSNVAAPTADPLPVVPEPAPTEESVVEVTPEEAVAELETSLDMPEIEMLDTEMDTLEAELDAVLAQ